MVLHNNSYNFIPEPEYVLSYISPSLIPKIDP
jgi:hypothetical protein